MSGKVNSNKIHGLGGTHHKTVKSLANLSLSSILSLSPGVLLSEAKTVRGASRLLKH
jgi:hypothetical protein